MRLIPDFSWSALLAGHVARHKPRRHGQDVISGAQWRPLTLEGQSATAEQWIAHVNDEGHEVFGEALGAGTPLVCTYLLGWTMGPSPCLLSLALLSALSLWGYFLWVSLMGDGSNVIGCVEMWTLVVMAVVLSLTHCFIRVRERTPEGIPLSGDDWRAICLETFLASTAFCLWDGLVVRAARTGDTSQPAANVMVFGAPLASWCAAQYVVRQRQRAFLEASHLAARVHEDDKINKPSRHDIAHARSVVNAVFKGSRDLRMLGLSRPELVKVASYFEIVGREADEARIIFFYTQNVELWEKSALLRAFNRGYEDMSSSDDGAGGGGDPSGLRAWIRQFLEDVDNSRNPLASILGVARASKPLLTREVLTKVAYSGNKKIKSWWLCGAIAKACDDKHVVLLPQLPASDDGGADMNKSHLWFALFAAALNENQNPMAKIQAVERDSLRARPVPGTETAMSGKKMSVKMSIGCEQVLRQAVATPAEADDFYVKERGLVLSTEAGGTGDSPPTITYSAGEVWQAELAREPVMLTERAFNSLWQARESRVMSRRSKDTLWRDSAELSSEVAVRVDFKYTLAFLRARGKALANAQAAAWRGWLMLSVWAMCTIVMQLVSPQYLPSLRVLALLFPRVGKADQRAHFLFVATHLWRFSPLGRVCLAFHPMSDAEIDDMAHFGFTLSAAIVTLGATSCPRMSGRPVCAAACVLVLLASVAPGLWFFHLRGKENVEEGSDIVVKYVGRSRGKGYAHRDSAETSRPLGRDALENTTSRPASANGGGQRSSMQTAQASLYRRPISAQTMASTVVRTVQASASTAARTAQASASTAIRSFSLPVRRTSLVARVRF